MNISKIMRAEETSFNFRTEPGKMVQGILHLSSDAGEKWGELYSNNMRIIPEADAFSGKKEKVRFGVDVTGLQDGDEVSGALVLVSREGEERIPVHVDVLDRMLVTSRGEIMSLREFAAWAAEEPEEAFRFFKSRRFRGLIDAENIPEAGSSAGRGDDAGSDGFGSSGQESIRSLVSLWKGLAHPPATITAMEEFLVGAGLKRRVKVTAESESAEFFGLRDSIRELITLRRSGRGSFALHAASDADFIELPKTTFTDQDFVGAAADFEYRILAHKLGRGVRRGTITLIGAAGEIRFSVTASVLAKGQMPEKIIEDRLRALLMETRLGYVPGSLPRPDYVLRSLKVIGELYAVSSRDISLLRLYQAYLEEMRGRRTEALSLLKEFRLPDFTEEGFEEEAAYLYVASLTGVAGVSSKEAADRVRQIARNHPESVLAMKLLFLTNTDIGHSPRRKKKYEQASYAAGVRSPLLYAEVVRDFRQSEELLDDLSGMNLMALLFATRRSLMTQELALRAAFLAEREKEYSGILFRILTDAYDKWPLDGILESIVRLLMKGQPRDGRCFPWYEKAVGRGLHIMRLYEYYCETLPEHSRQILPYPVRRYFAMTSTLSESGMAAVFANVIRNKDADPATYELYKDRAAIFAYDGLTRRKTGADYAALYREFVDRVTPLTAPAFSENVFAREIYTDDRHERCVVVCHDALAEEERVPLVRGRAIIHIYTPDARVFFEDAEGSRRAQGVRYTEEPLMELPEGLAVLKDSPFDITPGYTAFLAERETRTGVVSDASFSMWTYIAGSDEFSDELRGYARRCAVRGVLEDPERMLITYRTTKEELAAFAAADKAGTVKALLDANLYEDAYDVVTRTGTEGLDGSALVRLAGRMAEEGDDPERCALCAQVFRDGYYDERILSFLEKYFEGSLEELREVRKAAGGFFVPTGHIDGRILSRAIRTGTDLPEGPEILKSYVKYGGRRSLARKYLEFHSDAVLGTGRAVHPFVAACLAELYDDGTPMDFAMKLVLLTFYAQKAKAARSESASKRGKSAVRNTSPDGLTVHEEVQVDSLLEECGRRGLHFAFMKDLPESFVRQYQLSDKVFAEVKADAGDLVQLTYTLEDGEERTKPRTETLSPVFRRLYVRKFTLLYGEHLTYTISVTHDGKKKTSSVKTLSGDTGDMTGRGSFERINRMLKAKADGDEEVLAREMRSYLRARRSAEELFALEE